MNRRDNTLAILNHEDHDHIGNYMTDVFCTGCDNGFGLNKNNKVYFPGTDDMGYGGVVLKDIEAWESLVCFPDPSFFNWEKSAEIDLAGYDPFNQVHEYCMRGGPFVWFLHLLGLSGARKAMSYHEEATKSLLSAITDHMISVLSYVVTYYKPDLICIYEDLVGEEGLFLSKEAYEKYIMPCHRRFFSAVRSYGIIPGIHVSGKCSLLAADFVNEGAFFWEGCEPENDLLSLDQDLCHALSFVGCYDMHDFDAYEEFTDEVLRQSARDCMDRYAELKSFIFMGLKQYADSDKFSYARQVLGEEGLRYGTNYYRNKNRK